MFGLDKDGNKKIFAIIICVPLFVLLLFLEYYEHIPEDTWFWSFLLVDGIFEFVFPDNLYFGSKKRKFYYKKYLLGDKMFEQFGVGVGQQVKIKTLDEFVKGVVKSTDGDFIVIEKDKKTSVETVFVNKNAIQTIRIVKIK